jgi:HEAT repeat protein
MNGLFGNSRLGMLQIAPMKRRTLLALALLVFAIGLVLILRFRAVSLEPAYGGRPLRDWLLELDKDSGSTNYLAARKAIGSMGTNALPALIRYLRIQDPPLNAQRVQLKAKLKMRFNTGGEYDWLWHRRAAIACGVLGEAGAPAFPAMAEAMQNNQAADEVGRALSSMLPASAPVLTNVLATGAIVARCRAADALITAYSHPSIEEMARPALLAALHCTDPAVRATAATALQFWNTHLDLVVPALTRSLSDTSVIVRGNAASALGTIGSAAKSAVPELIKLLNDTNAYPGLGSGTVGQRALQMLRQIDPKSAANAEMSMPARLSGDTANSPLNTNREPAAHGH